MEVDPNSGFKFIWKKIDEVTKNHQDDTTFMSGIMAEIANFERCPVKSYLKYISKMHPRCNFLWQQAKDEVLDADIWYKPLKVGPHPLAGFMSRVSHDADLSCV